ncbi:MAG: CRISPR-associated endonuclease Cas6 [Candidatus Nitrosotenuis sp.]
MADKRIEICIAMFDFDSDGRISPAKFRGFMAHHFSNISEFHHHSENSYHYPLIQYKRIDGKLSIVGIDKFANLVSQNMSDIDHITTESEKIPVNNIAIRNSTFSRFNNTFEYEFYSPWIALNETNYEKYKQLGKSDKKNLLEKILIGNILSMFKGLGIFITKKVEVNIIKQSSMPITAHENKFVGFRLNFTCNTNLPDFLGLGKSVSKGFGTIHQIK